MLTVNILHKAFGDVLCSNVRIRQDVPARELTTFGVGSPASLVIEPQSIQALIEVLRILLSGEIPFKLLAGGSNVVLSDIAFDGAIVRLSKSLECGVILSKDSSMYWEDNDSLRSQQDISSLMAWPATVKPSAGQIADNGSIRVCVGAGATLSRLSLWAARCALSGCEFATGIPGTIGGALVMNAGAHGACMADIVECVYCLRRDGSVVKLDANKLCFGYRSSALAQYGVALGAILRFNCGDSEKILSRRREYLSIRKKTQPLHLPSAGSVFKNPFVMNSEGEKRQLSAGWLLEKAGMKGIEYGGVAYSTMHANWLVRISAYATASDVSYLVDLGKRAVREIMDIDIEPEIDLW